MPRLPPAYSSQKPPTTSIAASHGESSSSTIRSMRHSSFRPSGKYATFMIRQVAELRWIDQGLRDLPWWKGADNLDEVASPQRHPESRSFDNCPFEDHRVGIEIEDFSRLFEHHSGYTIEDIRSSLRRRMHLQARIEFATLGASRYGIRSTEVARFIQKHPTRLHAGSVSDSASSSRIDFSASVSTTTIVKSHGPRATIQECYEC